MGKVSSAEVWKKTSIQWFALLGLAGLLGVFHFRVDMAKWSIACLMSGEIRYLGQVGLMMGHTVISIALLLLLVARSRVVAYAVLPVVVFLWVVPTFLHVTVGPCMYPELITGALETSWKELSGLLTIHVLAMLGTVVLLSMGLAVVMRRFLGSMKQLPGRWVWSVALGYIGVTVAMVPLLAGQAPRSLLPLLFPPAQGNPEEVDWQQENQVANMLNETCPAYAYRVLMPYYRQVAFFYHVADYYRVKDVKKAELLPSRLECDDDVVVVLVIGESYRADHASWNGYARETLPQLSALRGNIINFPWFKSFATSTVSSIYGMLSDATCRNRNATHTSFLSVLQKHGFKQRLLLCRTTQWERNPQIATVLDHKLGKVLICEDTAGLESHMGSVAAAGGRQFVLVEDGTGHAPYDHEPQFGKFGNEGMDKFDNCLLQTDDVLYLLIAKLKGKKAVLLYSSDHGQSFGEQGCYMHGGALGVIKQRHVFSFVWYSDAYAAAHPDKVAAMRENANKPLSHDDIYRSILSLAGVECDLPTPDCGDFTKPLSRPRVTQFSLDE